MLPFQVKSSYLFCMVGQYKFWAITGFCGACCLRASGVFRGHLKLAVGARGTGCGLGAARLENFGKCGGLFMLYAKTSVNRVDTKVF